MSLSEMNKPGQRVPVKLWTPIHEVDSGALDQLERVARLPWVFHHVAVMPDVHHGKGCTVGSVIAMKDALAPAAVGVDIGCGMGAVRTSLRKRDLPTNLLPLRLAIEAAIPVGFNSHGEAAFTGKRAEEAVKREGAKLFGEFNGLAVANNLGTMGQGSLLGTAKRQAGTLGGGNHFIEICLDDGTCPNCENNSGYTRHVGRTGDEVVEDCTDHQTDPRVWLVLHSGSRNVGLQIAEHHIEIAQKLIHNEHIPDPDMAVFLAGTKEMAAYRNDLLWAQRYAFFNRKVMFELLKDAIESELVPHRAAHGIPDITYDEPILCHHNYVAEEVHFGENVIVTRKGAIRAGRGELGVIPGSMGTKSYIVRGKGNLESFSSASHGAGRRMSRGKAKKAFTLKDIDEQTAGVECRKDYGIIDELPGAYKNIDQVMQNQRDLVEVLAVLKQVLCVKG